jgi:hypothetical protein
MSERYRFSQRQGQKVKLSTGIQYATGAICLAVFFGLILFLFSNVGDSEDIIAGNINFNNTVPSYQIDLRGNADGNFVTPPIVRSGGSCNAEPDERCVSFDVYLDENAEGIKLEQITGDKSNKNQLYFLDCDEPTILGKSICVKKKGKIKLSYCAEGIQSAAYRITSIAKVEINGDTVGRVGGGKMELKTKGLQTSSIHWESIFPGKIGAYNNLLQNSNEANVSLIPTESTPQKIIYKVSGMHISACGDAFACSDTITLNIYPQIKGEVFPASAICAIGGEVNLYAKAKGGKAPYTYRWKDSNGKSIGNSEACNVQEPGTYQVEIRDALYPNSSIEIKTVDVYPSQNAIPSMINAENVSQCNATISWQALQQSYKYKIRFRKKGTQDWEYHVVLSPKASFKLQSLQPGNKYEYQVMNYASSKNSDTSGWSRAKDFTTKAGCIDASDLKVKVYKNEAVCYWDNNPYSEKQIVILREQGTTDWKQSYTVSNSVNSLRIPQIEEGKNYEWAVKSICKNSDSNNPGYTMSPINIFNTKNINSTIR